jgi:hypothetical protein
MAGMWSTCQRRQHVGQRSQAGTDFGTHPVTPGDRRRRYRTSRNRSRFKPESSAVEQRFCKPPEFLGSRLFFGRKSQHFIEFCELAGSGRHGSSGIRPRFHPPQKPEQLFTIGSTDPLNFG